MKKIARKFKQIPLDLSLKEVGECFIRGILEPCGKLRVRFTKDGLNKLRASLDVKKNK